MKYLLISLLLLTGCSTTNSYSPCITFKDKSTYCHPPAEEYKIKTDCDKIMHCASSRIGDDGNCYCEYCKMWLKGGKE